jgi:hypothetical protein
MKNAIMLVMFLSVIIKLNAQESVEKNQVKINFLLPSISYEKALSSKSTLYSEFGMSFGIYKPIYEGVVVLPFLNEEFRYYYNLEKRTTKGKSIAGNSGSFFALNAIYNFKSLNTDSSITSQSVDFAVIPSWGFQHTGKKGFSANLNLGYGYGFSNNGNQGVAMIKLSLGWILKGKK